MRLSLRSKSNWLVFISVHFTVQNENRLPVSATLLSNKDSGIWWRLPQIHPYEPIATLQARPADTRSQPTRFYQHHLLYFKLILTKTGCCCIGLLLIWRQKSLKFVLRSSFMLRHLLSWKLQRATGKLCDGRLKRTTESDATEMGFRRATTVTREGFAKMYSAIHTYSFGNNNCNKVSSNCIVLKCSCRLTSVFDTVDGGNKVITTTVVGPLDPTYFARSRGRRFRD